MFAICQLCVKYSTLGAHFKCSSTTCSLVRARQTSLTVLTLILCWSGTELSRSRQALYSWFYTAGVLHEPKPSFFMCFTRLLVYCILTRTWYTLFGQSEHKHELVSSCMWPHWSVLEGMATGMALVARGLSCCALLGVCVSVDSFDVYIAASGRHSKSSSYLYSSRSRSQWGLANSNKCLFSLHRSNSLEMQSIGTRGFS